MRFISALASNTSKPLGYITNPVLRRLELVRHTLLGRAGLALFSLCLISPTALFAASTVQQTIRAAEVEIDVIPKSGPGLADEGIALAPEQRGTGFSWTLLLQNTAVYTDLSMADATHGFASAELGQVYRTVDGTTWTQVMNLGFPHYWYGVHTFDPSTVFVSGFQNQTGDGIGRWSNDAGATWTNDLIIDPDNWLTISQFADRQHGVATAIGSGFTYYTTNGGNSASDWTRVLADPTQGWFAGNVTFRPDLHVYAAGISFCSSTDGGQTYTRRSSIDPVFDGGVSFPDPLHGWTGGGQISAPVQGWVHRTTDGGASWSGRILNPPYPIRSLLFLDESVGFAVGGNYFGAVGGIWSTTDGGDSWNLDVDTGCEMKGIDWARVNADSVSVWCAGSRSGVGRIYRTTLYHPETTASVPSLDTPALVMAASPNPFRASTQIELRRTEWVEQGGDGSGSDAARGALTIEIVDVSGRTLRRLDVQTDGPSGAARATWDGRDDSGAEVAAGTYFATASGVGSARLVRIH